MREGIVAGDADNGGIECCVFVELLGHRAELSGAAACEGHGDKKKNDVLFADVLGESEKFGAFRAFGDEGEIGGFGAS